MPEKDLGRQSSPSRSAVDDVKASRFNEAPRINVAFPFSTLKVHEPSKDLAALANLVEEIIDLLITVAPGPKVDELKERANTLAARL
jgi:hypothetical protein